MKHRKQKNGTDIVDTMRLITIIASVVVLVIGGLLLLPGPGQSIRKLFGPGEISAIDFAELVTTGETDEYLVCPLYLCLSTEPDAEPREFDVQANRLRAILLEYIDHQSSVKMLGFDPVHQQFDFSDQDPTMRLPDIITIKIIELGEQRSTLAIYSRSVSGFTRDGANKRRVDHWMNMLRSN